MAGILEPPHPFISSMDSSSVYVRAFPPYDYKGFNDWLVARLLERAIASNWLPRYRADYIDPETGVCVPFDGARRIDRVYFPTINMLLMSTARCVSAFPTLADSETQCDCYMTGDLASDYFKCLQCGALMFRNWELDVSIVREPVEPPRKRRELRQRCGTTLFCREMRPGARAPPPCPTGTDTMGGTGGVG